MSDDQKPNSDVVDENDGELHQQVKLSTNDTTTVAEEAAAVADETLEMEDAKSPPNIMSGSSSDSEGDKTTSVEQTDEASILKGLTEAVRDQTDLERDISHKATIALNEQEDERDNKRIERVENNKAKLVNQKRSQTQRLAAAAQNVHQRRHIQREIDRLNTEIAGLDKDISDIKGRMKARHNENEENQTQDEAARSDRRLPGETHRAFMLRTGKITPFSRLEERDHVEEGGLGEILMDAEDELELKKQGKAESRSHQNLKLPGFAETPASLVASEFGLRSTKKRRLPNGSAVSSAAASEDELTHKSASEIERPSTSGTATTDEDHLDSDDYDSIIDADEPIKKRKGSKKTKAGETEDLAGIDDGNEANYQARLRSWIERRSAARRHKQAEAAALDGSEIPVESDGDEIFKPSPDEPDHHFENGLKMPGDIYPSLFDYQKTGVQWLGELYEQQVGGIIGDEMGLGKTIQIISFLAALHYSKKLTKPVIVVAPATVLRQWVNEFHIWWPALRVSILHSSGSGMLNVASEARLDDEEHYYNRKDKKPAKGAKAAKRVVDRVIQQGHVLVTTYAGLQTYGDILIPVKWGYAVLDEGHKIRNPNTGITVACKELQTSNRIILSGTPMQNNLVELWSLFDFVYPMRLGTLVNFRNQFEVPIKIGGYQNATNLQVMTADKCAETLKDAISPYLLQRFKVDVAADLPKKTEQVLFCRLTKPQREAYETFLLSDEMKSILDRERQSLYGIDFLRKVCNHPDLLDKKLKLKDGYKWGNPNKSGKMQVVKALLELWKKAGDKILLFSQGVQMLDIIEHFVKKLDGFNYLRMDGGTNVKDRQTLVDRFNNDPDIDLFLLTTKVGGLGVNLTGANRVIIFDPDWNPSTDVQARERAWRLGQKKEVTIYRLMTAGTIEEKIYHRQIFKQFLSDKVLKDPKQRQTAFQNKDLHDLFRLGSSEDQTTETGDLFQGSQAYGNGTTTPEKKTRPSFVTPHSYTGDRNTTELIKPNPDPWATPVYPTPPRIRSGPWADPEREDDEVVRAITGLDHLEEYYDESANKATTNDQRIMENIFVHTGVHSVLEHDHIINGKKQVKADRSILEKEARKVASQAAAELRKAGELAASTPIGTVTWTGTVGETGRPQNIRRGGGPSSSNILSSLSARQGFGGPSSNFNSNTNTPNGGPRAKDFLRMIPSYLRRQGGTVPSQMLVVHFSHMCTSPVQKQEFMASLEECAELKQGVGRHKGRWVLKEEYRTGAV